MLRKRNVRERTKRARKGSKKGREENPCRHRRLTMSVSKMFHRQTKESLTRFPEMPNTFLKCQFGDPSGFPVCFWREDETLQSNPCSKVRGANVRQGFPFGSIRCVSERSLQDGKRYLSTRNGDVHLGEGVQRGQRGTGGKRRLGVGGTRLAMTRGFGTRRWWYQDEGGLTRGQVGKGVVVEEGRRFGDERKGALPFHGQSGKQEEKDSLCLAISKDFAGTTTGSATFPSYHSNPLTHQPTRSHPHLYTVPFQISVQYLAPHTRMSSCSRYSSACPTSTDPIGSQIQASQVSLTDKTTRYPIPLQGLVSAFQVRSPVWHSPLLTLWTRPSLALGACATLSETLSVASTRPVSAKTMSGSPSTTSPPRCVVSLLLHLSLILAGLFHCAIHHNMRVRRLFPRSSNKGMTSPSATSFGPECRILCVPLDSPVQG